MPLSLVVTIQYTYTYNPCMNSQSLTPVPCNHNVPLYPKTFLPLSLLAKLYLIPYSLPISPTEKGQYWALQGKYNRRKGWGGEGGREAGTFYNQQTILLALNLFEYCVCTSIRGILLSWNHGVRWSNRTYVALALLSLLATCMVFWSHRRRDIGYTAVIFLPERMYITLDSSTCTSYPGLKRHKCLWQFGKAFGLHELSSFLLSQ